MWAGERRTTCTDSLAAWPVGGSACSISRDRLQADSMTMAGSGTRVYWNRSRPRGALTRRSAEIHSRASERRGGCVRSLMCVGIDSITGRARIAAKIISSLPPQFGKRYMRTSKTPFSGRTLQMLAALSGQHFTASGGRRPRAVCPHSFLGQASCRQTIGRSHSPCAVEARLVRTGAHPGLDALEHEARIRHRLANSRGGSIARGGLGWNLLAGRRAASRPTTAIAEP